MLPMVQSEPVLFSCGVHSMNTASSPPTTSPPSLTPESDVDELVDIFFDVDVAATTYPRIESCDLQLGDTWRGMQGKMSVTAPDKKIRKKSDKPQSQINKCHNEKRRREQENETINQLEELLGTCLAEVKQPDKNGIVREATRQIQEVLQRRRECPDECPLRAAQSVSPVQAGEVSSTQPQPICAGLHYTELTTLIEALKHYTGTLGWILLEINSKGEIECVTENIKDLILRDRTELYKKSIYSLLHVKDHAKLKPLLRSIQNFNWSTGEADKFQAIQAGLIVKNSNGTDTSVVEAVIHAAPVRGSASEEAGSVMCVIRRCEDASAALIPVCAGPPAITAGKQADHIVFRLDCNYNILSCDLSGVENFIKCRLSLVGTPYLELVESADRGRVLAHLQEAACLPAPPAVSDTFRLRVGADRTAVRVCARSRLFRAKPTSGEPDFIMSTHSVLGDEEPAPPAPTPDPADPDEPRYRPHASPAPAPAPPFTINDFDLDPWAVHGLLGDMSEDHKNRKDASAGEGSSSRAPSTPGEPSPLHHQHHAHHHSHQLQHAQQQQQQQHNHQQQQHNHQQQQHNHQQQQQQQHNLQTQQRNHQQHLQQQQHQQSQQHEESNRLRSILTGNKPDNRILIGMLRQEDEEAAVGEISAPQTPQPPVPAPSLVRMLSDNTDDDTEDTRRTAGSSRGVAHQSALLSQLLQPPTNNGQTNNGRTSENAESVYIEKMTQKRKFEEAKGMVPNAKRATPENQQVSSSASSSSSSSQATSVCPVTSGGGMSPLCQKNQILVSLLAKEQSTPTTPPQLTNPGVRPYQPRPRPPHQAPSHHQPMQMHQARHHSALSEMLTANNHSRLSVVNGGASGQGAGELRGSHLQIMLQQGGGPTARYPPPHYAPRAYPQPQPGQHNARGSGDSEVPSDKTLSDILDDVLATMSDSDRPTSEINMRQRQENEDRSAAVKAITASLMLCEKVTKHPVVSSPGTPPVYSVQSPSACPMPTQGPLYPSRPPPTIAEQHARLLQMQRTQQMLVSPEAAEQPQSDLGSTINALVTETPPNVTLLPRGDYHPSIYQPNQMGSNYGAIKITSAQQNPMLNRQINVGGSGGYVHSGVVTTHTAAALHTPMTPQPYHRPPRPHLVGGYYDEGGAGDCGEYARCTPLPPHASHATHASHASHAPHATHAPHLTHSYRSPGHLQCPGNGSPGLAGSGGGAGGTSEYVRNELRAVVGARSARPDLHTLQPPDMDSLMNFDIAPPGGGGVVGGRAAGAASAWDSPQSTPSTTEAVSAEAAAGGDEAGAAAPAAGKASLLQKLLSQ